MAEGDVEGMQLDAPFKDLPPFHHARTLPVQGVDQGTDSAIHALIVDDDDDLRGSLRYLLEMDGYEVMEARDGAEALDILRTAAQPFVVLLDLMMPRLGGMGVLNAVANDRRLVSRHVYVMVTANRDRLDAAGRELLTRLRVPIVTKPFEVDTLLAAVVKAAQQLKTPPA
jgi:CheY-like chemotaxis protein